MAEIRLSNGFVITNAEERIRAYCGVEVYRGYDDCHDPGNTVTPDTIRAANRLYARIEVFLPAIDALTPIER